jgi:hypothetical protein
LTVPDIENMVRTAVQAQTKEAGFINVRLVSRQSKVYYVVGEVNSPGAFQLQGRETVLDAIMQAGGLTDNASPDNAILSRPTRPECPRVVLPVCLRQIVQVGDTTTNYQIAPGDRIFVPSRTLLETIFGARASHSPCKASHVPHVYPPYPGGPCCDPPSGSNGFVTPGTTNGSPVPAQAGAAKTEPTKIEAKLPPLPAEIN